MSPEEALLTHIVQSGADIRVVDHGVCRTSLESAAARASAGAPHAIGAKALIVYGRSGYAMFVLPGSHRLDGRRARAVIGKYRFATPEQVRDATGGLEIGTIPPFARPVFPNISRLIVDRGVVEAEWIGFNAAGLTRSVVMRGQDYVRAATPDLLDVISLAPDQADP